MKPPPARASHPAQRSAPRECNQTARIALLRKQSVHREAHRAPRTCSSAPALRSTLRWFRLVREKNCTNFYIYLTSDETGLNSLSLSLSLTLSLTHTHTVDNFRRDRANNCVDDSQGHVV